MNTLALSQEPDLADGAKADSLAWLRKAGFAVPTWCVVPTSYLDRFLTNHHLSWPAAGEATALARLREALLQLPLPAGMRAALQAMAAPLLAQGQVAARSSATLEDLDDASFAGQYESYLELADFAAVELAIRRCWASAATPRVAAYLDSHGYRPAQLQMAVILQQMVPAQSAGVSFTMNPVSGKDDEIVIEACPGLGEALVSGKLTPDRYRYAWRQECLREVSTEGTHPVLTESRVAELARLCARAQAERGRPLDLEWAHDGKQFWFLQARPITAHATTAYEGEWTTADMKDGGVSAGVCTPFMASLYEQVFATATPDYFDGVGLTAPGEEEEPWYMVAYGRPYWNVGHIKRRLARLPGYCERGFDEDLGIAVAYEGDGVCTGIGPRTMIHGLRVLSLMKASFRDRLALDRELADGFRLSLDQRELQCPQAMTDLGLRTELEELLAQDYLQLETAYFLTIYDNSNAQTLFQEKLAAVVGKEEAKVAALPLLGGLHDLSHLRPTREEEGLLAEIMQQPGLARDFLSSSVEDLASAYREGLAFPAKQQILRFLSRWGWMAPRTLEILQPRWSEDPTPLLASLQRGLTDRLGRPEGAAGKGRHEQVEQQQRTSYERSLQQVCARIRSMVPGLARSRQRSFLEALETTRQLLWWREEMRMHSTRMYAQMRRFTLEYGRRLERDGHLEQAEDIFFLEYGEVLRLTRGGAGHAALRAIVTSRRLYYDGFLQYQNADEIGARWTTSAKSRVTAKNGTEVDGRDLRGIAGSAGSYRGRACVITSVAEVGRLQAGDILVTRFTDPGWTTAFAHLGAVVTETGGVLSHAAVIAREYGFPAVLAVSGAMAAIDDGEIIEVDGDRGLIHRYGKAPQPALSA